MRLFHAYSGDEAIKLIQKQPDIALIFLDVIMETDDAGLKVVKYIREQLKNNFVRIILRTGQPGQVPEGEIVLNYDINDYKSKEELTSQKLFTSVISSLRAYKGLKKIDHDKRCIEKLQKQTENANRAKSEFLANITHEILTPMNAIIGMTGAALDLQLSADLCDYLNTIRTSANTLLTIIHDILDFSKIEAGKLHIERKNFNLSDITNDLAGLFSKKLATTGLEMAIVTDKNVPNLLVGDPLRLSQILIKLLSNAIKFTPKGEVIFSIHNNSQSENQVELLFKISDSGIGISPELINHLFTAFTQADGSNTRKFEGVGLGLTISKRLIELMDGKLSIESEPGSGTAFSFSARFPLQKDITEQACVIPSGLTGKKLLLLQKNDSIRNTHQKLLQSYGFQVDASSSQKKAREQLKTSLETNSPYQLLLTDWAPVSIGSKNFLELIETDLKLNKLPIILLVNFNHKLDTKTIMLNTGKDFLLKPIQQSLLFETIIAKLSSKTKIPEELVSNLSKPQAEEINLSQEQLSHLSFHASRLIKLLSTNDLDAENEFSIMKKLIEPGLKIDLLLIEDKIHIFDFKNALSLTNKLLKSLGIKLEG
jgi:signal transduction histidine kinase/DNA-binding NarL/FixJ family response regulator